MNEIELRKSLEYELNQNFSGWDFSYLDDRVEYSPLPWSYTKLLNTYFKNANTCLDMGTGGGEFIDSFKELPPQMYATEGYAPNIEIAKNRLNKRGIIVKAITDDNNLPFEENTFDLVVNKHESYSVLELSRIIKSNGYFITQQIGGMNNIDLNSKLGALPPSYYDWNVYKAITDLGNNGFKIIEYSERMGYQRFYDIGSIVYYLKCIPWQVPDFSIDKYFERLLLINNHIENRKYIDFIDDRFYLIAKKELS